MYKVVFLGNKWLAIKLTDDYFTDNVISELEDHMSQGEPVMLFNDIDDCPFDYELIER